MIAIGHIPRSWFREKGILLVWVFLSSQSFLSNPKFCNLSLLSQGGSFLTIIVNVSPKFMIWLTAWNTASSCQSWTGHRDRDKLWHFNTCVISKIYALMQARSFTIVYLYVCWLGRMELQLLALENCRCKGLRPT